MLSEGRRKLIKELDAMLLAHEKREQGKFDKLWSLLGVDKVEAERFEKIHGDMPAIIRNVKYISISSGYIARIHVLRDEPNAAQRSISQFAEFMDRTLKTVDAENSLYPDRLRQPIRELITISNGATKAWIDERDLIVDASYEELLP
ncbi:MAG TPA: hypothetical protein DCO65_01825 [Spartobacteria bacterium]|jgi:hypothetical protein|nr:hypothetical protein [Spartobacteria bacterium]